MSAAKRRGNRDPFWAKWAKAEVKDAADEEIAAADAALAAVYRTLHSSSAIEDLWFQYRATTQTIEDMRVSSRSPCPADQPAEMTFLAYDLLADAAWYQIEVTRGHSPRVWYCIGCEAWHDHGKGRPPQHHAPLMEMMRKAMERGGLARGEAREVWWSVTSRGSGPTLRRWQAFIQQHGLKTSEWRRTLVKAHSPGRYHFVNDVVHCPSLTK